MMKAQAGDAPPGAVAEAELLSPADGSGLLLFRAVTALFLALGLWVCWQATGFEYYTPVGPGPGFFPLWLGILLALFSLATLVASFTTSGLPHLERRLLPPREARIPMAATFAMIGFFALTVQRLGFAPSMFVVLIVLLLLNRVRLPSALMVALGGSLGVGYAFSQWLDVYLPTVPFGLLGAIGL